MPPADGGLRHDLRRDLRMIRERHVAQPGLWQRLESADPGRARQTYLQEQLALTDRLAATMATALEAAQLMSKVVNELHDTLGVYLAVIQRLDDDGVLRIVASAGPGPGQRDGDARSLYG